ncbi:MAG: response regulator transcription factor [Balneolaceae bacterium]
MDTIPLIIAENQDISRSGLNVLLGPKSKFHILDSVQTGKDLITVYKKRPDATCIISSSLPDTNIHELMKELKSVKKSLNCIVITQSTDLSHLNQCLKAGVKGYITRNVSEDELIDIVSAVSEGQQAFGKSVSQLMIGRYADVAQRSTSISKKSITKREKEILKLIVEGFTSAEIAKRLYISARTVETHRSNLMSKLGLKNTAALVRYALEEKQAS